MTRTLERTPSLPSQSDWLITTHRSLETLSSYIRSQRELLSRTQHEIERLHALKGEVRDKEDLTVDDVSQKVSLFASV